jgi:hypothetical protein
MKCIVFVCRLQGKWSFRPRKRVENGVNSKPMGKMDSKMALLWATVGAFNQGREIYWQEGTALTKTIIFFSSVPEFI